MRDFALSSLAALLAAAVIVAGGVLPAAAQTSTTATVATERNVYTGGGQVRTAGPVQGDFTAAGGKVIVEHPVGGDASLAGGSVDVRAPVADDVRAAGGDVTIESTVGGELFATGGNVTLLPAARVAHRATLYGGNVTVGGRVEGELHATARKITIDGEVGGSARLVAEEIELGPKARIAGALTYASRGELKKAEGAVIGGTVTRVREDPARPGRDEPWQGERGMPAAPWVGGVMGFLGLLALGAIFLLLLPRFGAAAAQRIGTSPALAPLVGFGVVVAVPVLAVLLFVTILGIPLGIALLAGYPALLLGGFVVGVLYIARRLALALRQEEPRTFGRTLGYFAIALLLVLLVGALPFLGAFIAGVLAFAGIGACVLELHARRTAGDRAGADAPLLTSASAS